MKRLLRITILGLITVACVAALAGWLTLRASLPRRSGEIALPGLTATVRIEFDALGIARVRATNHLDALAAQGFVHAQDRFFQMDLTRRSAAGELAALFGPAAIDFDSQRRIQQLRKRAQALLNDLPARHRAQLESYAAGVNAGLADLSAWPPEYLLLRERPAPWQPEDSMLVVFALYTMLSNNDSYERHNGALREHLPAAVFEFMTPLTARDDRPLAARNDADQTGGYAPASVPPPELIDLREISYDGTLNVVRQPLSPNGSNSWAIAGEAAGSQSLVANDPHLGIRVPNIFHRAELYWDTQAVRGVGIPGLPGIMIGANRSVAWGTTVSYADQADFVVVDPDSTNPDRYLVPTGAEEFSIERESIAVAGREQPIEIEVQSTRWGPIVDHDHAGRPLALHASWLQADGLDLSLFDIADSTNVNEAIGVLRAWRGPSLSWVVGDDTGSVGWAINGPVPIRRNFDGAVPERWGTGDFGWRGEASLPFTVARENNFVYSANNRQVTMPYARTLSRVSLPPHRARAITEALEQDRVSDEASSLALQLDTRVTAFDQLRDIILEVVPEDEPEASLAQVRGWISDWNGYASRDSLAMPILVRYYDQLLERVLGPALVHIREADPHFSYRWPLVDEVLRRVLEARPAHFLSSRHASWKTWLREILRSSLSSNNALDGGSSWGEINRLDVGHPLAGVPGPGWLLRWPKPALPGNTFSLRVAKPDFGAVIRMNIRPASPETGILQLAGGQSGHFLSPHYADQLTDWADDTPTPFLAGPTRHSYELHPLQ